MSSTKTIAKHKGQLVTWPYHIKCGLCGVERQVDTDSKHSGIISKFKLGRLFYIQQGPAMTTTIKLLFPQYIHIIT